MPPRPDNPPTTHGTRLQPKNQQPTPQHDFATACQRHRLYRTPSTRQLEQSEHDRIRERGRRTRKVDHGDREGTRLGYPFASPLPVP